MRSLTRIQHIKYTRFANKFQLGMSRAEPKGTAQASTLHHEHDNPEIIASTTRGERMLTSCESRGEVLMYIRRFMAGCYTLNRRGRGR